MQQKHTWFGDQAFGEYADVTSTIEFNAHSRALGYVQKVLTDPGGAALLQGPEGSGKKTIIGRFLVDKAGDAACAVVDASRLKPEAFLTQIVTEFGYVTELASTEELLQMINVFAVQQLRTCQAPILIVENVDQMFPGALRALAILATFQARGQFAIRLIMTSQRGLEQILSAESMTAIATRASSPHTVQPITPMESMKYLYARMEACGVREPDSVFPVDVCDRLHEQSGGRPGYLNACAMAALEHATSFPLSLSNTEEGTEPEATQSTLSSEKDAKRSPPRLIITRRGQSPVRYSFDSNKALIGRSKLSDVVVDDDFASKAHALLLLYSDALVLMDLNSTNGTLVNSAYCKCRILRTDDIISLGHYRIKIENAPTADRDNSLAAEMADTAKMKNLQEMRKQKLRRARQGDRERRRKA